MKPSLSSSEVRALFHERLDALLPDCDKVMDSAGYGRTLHDLDDFLFIAGKGFLNEVLKEKLQERIEACVPNDARHSSSRPRSIARIWRQTA